VRRHVLIAEDDDDTREMYAWGLRAGGWVVEAVATGVDAIFVATRDHPDVIVMDLLLPGLDGFEAVRRLKALPETWDIPVVALTGANPAKVESLAWGVGCAAFVSKPCMPDDLRALLERLLMAQAGRRS